MRDYMMPPSERSWNKQTVASLIAEFKLNPTPAFESEDSAVYHNKTRSVRIGVRYEGERVIDMVVSAYPEAMDEGYMFERVLKARGFVQSIHPALRNKRESAGQPAMAVA
jgi:hypothetical protein